MITQQGERAARTSAQDPCRVAIGPSDPFYAATRSFVTGMHPRPTTEFGRGGHDLAFWLHSAPRQIAFLGRCLHGE
jgi:hypothetical protein